ncbi:MAG: alpha/beta hydrolase [Acidobacteriota bacterium]
MSLETRQTLRLLNLDRRWHENPTAVISTLETTRPALTGHAAVAATAELLQHLARAIEVNEPERALGWHLLAATRAYEFLFEAAPVTVERTFDRRFQRTRHVYNSALADYLRLRQTLGKGLQDHVQGAVFEIIALRVEDRCELWDPPTFDQFIPSRDLKVKGFRNNHRRSGLGTALTAIRQNNQTEWIERFIPSEGYVNPATAVLTFEPGDSTSPGRTRRATLTFYDPRRTETMELGGVRLPLTADFTTPFGYLAGSTNLQRAGVQGFLQSEKALERQGLFMLEPYDPNKIPLIMVHGLRSSPLAWAELTNDLSGEPRIRDAYQIWHYRYATSLPFLFSGRLFRQTLEELRQTLDPTGRDPAVNSMVFVAHSMGGLLTKTLATSSGESLWETTFQAPPEELRGLLSDIEAARQTFIFEAKPYVDRVIFIAVPHRGSSRADSLIGQLGSSLVALPESFKSIFRRVTEANYEVLSEEMRRLLAKGGPTSVRALSPQHPVIRALAEIPIEEAIPFHTLLGDRGLVHGHEAAGSDGWVTYDSAHLEGAASELVLPARHDLYEHPLAIAEVKRILKLHLEARAVELSASVN